MAIRKGGSRDEIYRDIEQMMGTVPEFLKTIPDSSLELEWELMKKVLFEESAIPAKYKELIGVAISAEMRCRFCSFFHTEVARLHGATDAEIEDAVHVAKSSAGWSAYINGMQTDFEQFKKDVRTACDHVRSLEEKKKGKAA